MEPSQPNGRPITAKNSPLLFEHAKKKKKEVLVKIIFPPATSLENILKVFIAFSVFLARRRHFFFDVALLEHDFPLENRWFRIQIPKIYASGEISQIDPCKK